MVFPTGDDDTGRAKPLVNYLPVAASALVFALLKGFGAGENRFTYARATAPPEIVTGRDVVTPGCTSPRRGGRACAPRTALIFFRTDGRL